MTNIQLLLLATNNFNASAPLSHTHASYVYQFYYAQIAHKQLKLNDFMKGFIEQVEPILKNNSDLYNRRDEIYQLIQSYLQQAETRFIQRKMQINKE